MSACISTLDSGIQEAKKRAADAAAALDEAILTDPELSHKTRMVLIHLQSTVRQQSHMLEQMAVVLEYLDSRCDIIVKHVTQ